MRTRTILAIILALAFSTSAYAQLGDLKSIVKKAAKEVKKDDAKSDDAGQSDKSPLDVGKKSDAPKAAKGGSRPAAKKDADRKYPPGLSFATVLNGVKLLPKDGKFTLNHIQTAFLPEGCEGGFVVLRTADGKELYQWDWKPDHLKKPYTLLNVHNVVNLETGEKIAGHLDMAKPGKYVLDFYLPDEHYYTFPFTISKAGSDDPFGDGDAWLLDGDWEDCAYWFYPEADETKSLYWKVWLRHKGSGEADAKIKLEVKRDADGTLVCQNREDVSFRLKPDWVRYEFDMIFPPKGTSGGAYFKAKDLLATDGDYTLTIMVNDKPRGTWKFAVKGGKLNYTGRTLREKADPLTFIEGGRDAWWYTREEAKKASE
ncbi:MAG: hypothetical protein JXA69_07070 [Phycisphaerae bacterium]|nr:hypothetical protein [Phycisphaerae bacterium]